MWHRVTVPAAVLVMLAAPRPADANGRYPLANQLVVDPGDPNHLVARTTFGVLRSDDAGAHWTWVCEDALGALNTAEDPALALTGDGTTLVAFSQGISVSHDGCTWSAAGGLPAGRFAVDVTVSPRRPHAALAIELLVDAGTYDLQMVSSADDGATWDELGAPLADLQGTTVEVAPSTADRVYVSGKGVVSQQSVIARSDDGGRTFTSFVLGDVAPAAGVFIGAVDPDDPDILYLRVSPTADAPGRVLVSRNGGVSFETLLTVPGDLTGFALSPDGATLAVGSVDSGLYVGSTAGGALMLTGAVKPSCLTWVGTRLYACAKEAVDPFSIGVSDDNGASFTPLLRFSSITPSACAAASSAGICTAQWAPIATALGADAGARLVDGGTSAPAARNGCACDAGPVSAHDGGALPSGLAGLAMISLAATIFAGRRRKRSESRR